MALVGTVVAAWAAGVGTMSQPSPVAYVLEHEDKWTQSAHASTLLESAGFEVLPLPLDVPPTSLRDGIVVLGSFSTEIEGYKQWAGRYATDLRDYVRRGNVLLQLTQADQEEDVPPFLGEGLYAKRGDADFSGSHVMTNRHSLLEGLPDMHFSFHASRTVWESFVDQRGFLVVMSSHPEEVVPSFLEGELGRGKVLLSAMPLDKTITPPEGRTDFADAEFERFNRAFFSNLAKYVVDVRAGRAGAVRPTLGQADLAQVEPGSWSIVVLPDTQVYAEDFPGLFSAQTSWILHNRRRLDVRIVLHLGDITNQNTPEQWQRVQDSMSLLDGKVPYVMAPGNHDYGPRGGAKTRDTLYNRYFPFDKQAKSPTFGGAYRRGHIENTYHLFEAGGRKWIVLSLEWGPRDRVVEWANTVMHKYPDRSGILITHAYMYSDSTRYDWATKGSAQNWNPHAYGTEGGVNDGEELWQKLVRKHNFKFVLNGHVLNDGTGYLVSKNDAGRNVHQILANYQFRNLGGEAYLRVFEFSPDGRTVRIKAYSPLYNKFMLKGDQSFVIDIGPVSP